jgi:hypothetical protein
MAISASPHKAIVNAGTFLFEDGFDDAGGMRGRWRRPPRVSMRRQDPKAVDNYRKAALPKAIFWL